MGVIGDWKLRAEKEHHGETKFVLKTNYAFQLARALAYIHEHRIIYRDLKPQNIGLLGHTVKLFDFGLSRALPEPESVSSIARENECFLMSFAGTTKYMAPEMFTTRRYNLKADVYSWSLVFYEMLTLVNPDDSCDQRPELDP